MASNSTDINAIIVGSGYAGLSTAIELARRGYNVRVFEAVKSLTQAGDIIQLASNSTKIIKKWGPVLEQLVSKSAQPKKMTLRNKYGEILVEQQLPSDYMGFPIVQINRGLAQHFMYEYAKTIGVVFHFGARVTEYFEDENSAGIVIDGQRHTADVVLAGDGVHSKANALIAGRSPVPASSGFAVYRSWFPMDRIRNDPILKDIVESKKDIMEVWIGPDTHGMVLTNTTLQTVVVFLTHKDTYTTEESWNFAGRVEDMLEVSQGWNEILRAAIRGIPTESLIDWKLLWRDPAKNWVSKRGRIALIGDASHPHLPTSGQGGGQAIEDGATIGALLEKSGKWNIPLALTAFEKLRYERTSLTQRMGWELRHRWHQTDWELIKSTPELLNMPQPDWLFGFDPEKYVDDNYEAVANHIKHGTPFKNSNLPEGYVHEEWTVEGMMALEKEQANEANFKTHKDLLSTTLEPVR